METLKYIFFNRRNPFETLELVALVVVIGCIVFGAQLIQW